MKRVITIISLIVTVFTASAKLPAKFLYDTEFAFWFDNREYDSSSIGESQTLFGVRLAPEIGVGISDSAIGNHRLMGGVQYIQPIGKDFRFGTLLPTIYYRFSKWGFTASLGMTPYSHLIEDLPDYLMSDSIKYMHPNIQGALFQYQSRHGFVEALCDWRGMCDSTTREAFRIVFNGRYRYKWFNVGGMGQMNHLACSHPAREGEGVCDDLLVNPYAGIDFGSMTPLDSLTLRAGYMLGIQRDRLNNEDHINHGLQIDFFMRWKYLGLRNSLYYGNPQYNLYKRYGAVLNQGSEFYQASFYNRTDIFVYLFNNSFVNCFVSVNLDVADGTFGWRQQVIAQFRLDGIHNYKERTDKLRTVLGK